MSFSSLVKDELARVNAKNYCCKLAELSALCKLDGSVEIVNSKLSVRIVNENAAVARKIFILLKDLFNLQTKVKGERKVKLKKNIVYNIRIDSSEKISEILANLGLLTKRGNIEAGISYKIIQKECCKRAYLRGAFLGGGSINNPEKDYHLEIITTHEKYAKNISQLMQKVNLQAKVSSRKNWWVVYLKESEQIADFLNIVGAHTALLEFENIRIIKEAKNRANRLANCDNANVDKAVEAATKQLLSIQIIDEYMGINNLSEPLQKVARARLRYPEMSLRELGDVLEPKLTKSGMNHRMRKLEEIAINLTSEPEITFVKEKAGE